MPPPPLIRNPWSEAKQNAQSFVSWVSWILEYIFCTFFKSPFHADYEIDLNHIPMKFLSQNIVQTLRWNKTKSLHFHGGF